MEKKSALVLENEDLLTTSGWGSIPVQCFYGGATRSEYKSHLDNVLMESNKECFPAEENGHKKCEIKEESDFDYEIIRSDEESDYVKGNTYSSESTRENPEIIHKVAFTESKIETTNDKIVSSNDSSKAKANIYEVVQRAESLKNVVVGENGFHGSSEFHYLPLDTPLDLIGVVRKITETDNFGADKEIKHEDSKAEKDFEIHKISFKEGNQVQNSAFNDTFKADSNAESKICDRFLNQHMIDCVECKEIDIFDDMFETDNFPTTEIINFANDEEFQDNVLPCFIDNQKFNENLIEVRDFQTNDEDPFYDDKLLKTSFQPVIDIIKRDDNASELVEGWVVVNSNIHMESENITLDSDLKLPKVGYSNADNEKVKLIDEQFKSPVDRLPPLSSEETQELTDNTMCPNLGEVPAYVGCPTASNKKIKLTEMSLQNTIANLNFDQNDKCIFLDMKQKPIDKTGSAEKNVMSSDHTTPFIGFHTASNKKVEISENALKRINKELSNCAMGLNYLMEPIENVKNSKKKEDVNAMKLLEAGKQNPVVIGFQTASKKKIEVSKEALQKIKKVIEGWDYEQGGQEKMLDVNLLPKNKEKFVEQVEMNKEIPMFVGFSTASNKRVEVSEDALAKIKSTVNVDANMSVRSTDLVNLINTQASMNFNEADCAKVFQKNVPPDQRSASPILQCRNPKRRKISETRDSSIPKNLNTDLQNLINTQVTNDFNETVHTEEFHNDPSPIPRSTSPVLQCSSAKRRKIFRTPISKKVKTDKAITTSEENKCFPEFVYKYKTDYKKLKRNSLSNLQTKNENELQLNVHIDLENIMNSEFDNTRNSLTGRKIDMLELKRIFMHSPDINRRIIPEGCSSNANVELELTDGWYTIKATIDDLLKRMVSVGRIRIGTKIITQGAELVNCDQGVAPWEDTTNVRLKIYGNSTRRVRWNTRLGFHGNSAILVPLSSVKLGGGKVSKIKVFVARVYPLLYMEKFEDGSTVTRSERLEHLYEAKCEVERQIMLEKIYDEVEKEFDGKSSTDSEEICVYGSGCKNTMDTGSQIAKCLKKCKDPLEFQANLSESQSNLLKQHTLKRQEKNLKEFQDKIQEKIESSNLKMHRNVMAVLKVRIVDIKLKDGQCVETTKGLLSIWNVNENVTEIFKEGTWMEASNVLPTGHSMFNKITVKDEQKYRLYMEELSRICVPISQIAKYPYKKYEFSEIDTVGLVFAVEPTMLEFRKQKNQFLQNVYITDEKRNFICVNFWGGLQKFGLENLIDTGQIVICMNLQKRYGSIVGSIPQFRVTEFSCFTRTPKGSKSRMLYDELKGKFNSINISMFCEECLKLKSGNTRRDNNENIFPYKSNNAQYAFNRGNYVNASLTADKSVDIIKLDLSDIDFESTFKDVNMDDLSPSERLRKKRLNEKLSKLRMYDEPPKLSPIYIINKSSKANSSYTSPLLENVGIRKDVSYDNSKNANSRISVNNIVTPKNVKFKSNINRSAVNPIKLDFSANVASGKNVNVDMFSEEFDPSPPLSLDSQSF
ncbi:Breast cancer type 2 susceptibility protein homolog [Eumeta japonica]|uniref:Breast cancer type 2 susceptibility protein homolog n=1 Tax=Eumeta variegata TaxID=151549 RepID=A0A4C1UYD3_EUMVA|nr:Breast cancer type 2 susceptibility protein homolog [Eumeta japonica]